MSIKKRILSLFLCIVTVFSMTTMAYGAVTIEHTDKYGKTVKLNDFLDTKGHWAHDTILKCAEYGLVAGNNGYYMPNKPIKRGDLAIIIDRMLGLKTVSYNLFNDLPNDSYYRDAVLRCVAAGYIAGTSANTVSPEGFATREQVAVIICRMFNIDTSYYGYTSFADDAKIGAWAKPSVAAVKRLGYMVGGNNNQFNPKSNITRAELITLINNIANTYIPKTDRNGSGSDFKGTFPTNIVTCRNITLNQSTVGRDLILTQSASTLTLNNTTVMGRLLVMARSSITLSNSKISQIYLVDGKSTISGITSDINEVYIANYASESSLDNFPVKLVLESGVRVRIDNKMYENNSLTTKTYYGDELKADLAAEQGFVVGGPKITNVKFVQTQDNSLTVENVKINVGENRVEEVGVIWLDQEDDEDIVNPTYQNKDGKVVYKSNKILEPFGFDVGTVKGTRAYRVYAIDDEGLYAYSNTFTFTEFDFNISMKVLDNDYPKKLDVELIMQGDSIPEIRNIRVVYDNAELYKEEHSEVVMRHYVDSDSEYQPDATKYRRYIATINSDYGYDKTLGETVYYPPTAFGYIVTFTDGTIINRFPVLTDVVPAGVKPVTTLSVGSVSFSGNNKINFNNNKIVTNHIGVQEVGIAYRESSSSSVTSPSENFSAWNTAVGAYNIDPNSSYTFNASVFTSDKNSNTFYCPYVKTSGGYYFGSVSKVSNNWVGDEGGPKITGNLYATVLDEDTVILKIPYVSENQLDIYADNGILTATKNGSTDISLEGAYLSKFNPIINDKDGMIYLCLDNLSAKSDYGLTIRLEDSKGLVSNIMSVNFNTSNMVPISLTEKAGDSKLTIYKIVFPDVYNYRVKRVYFATNNNGQVLLDTGVLSYSLHVKNISNLSAVSVELECEYSVPDASGNLHYYPFNRTITLY